MDEIDIAEERFAALFFCQLSGLSAKQLFQIRRHFGGFSHALAAAPEQVARFVPEKKRGDVCRQIASKDTRFEAVELLQAKLDRLGAKPLIWADEDYPPLLSEIDEAPSVLYVQGDLDLLQFPQVAIVGSRKMTQQGARDAFRFSSELVERGFAITSGLAAGIDTQAHRAALSNNGKTIAVVGCGQDIVYPKENSYLRDQILDQGGCIVSEFRPGTRPFASHFPQRNRIICGLSWGLLVVEASLRSGSLISARLAMEQNREVFALPGSIHDPLKVGCHQLIRQGATLVTDVVHILQQLEGLVQNARAQCEVERSVEQAKPTSEVSSEDPRVPEWLVELGFEPFSFEQAAVVSGLSVSSLTVALSELEIHGVLTRVGTQMQRMG